MVGSLALLPELPSYTAGDSGLATSPDLQEPTQEDGDKVG